MRLTEEYIAEARQRAYRFQGQWTGTSGALAADSARLILERKELMGTIAELEQSNAAMRAAIEARGGCCDGGKCHAKAADIELPDGYQAYTLTPAEPVPEAAFDEPIPAAVMDPAQLEAAWSGVKSRQQEIHARIRDPYASDPLDRRTVGQIPESADAVEAARKRTGTTAKFGTGAVRSDTFEDVRYDLISPVGIREVARACAEGAEKYSDFNWERGMPVNDLLNHALGHIYQFLSGDRSEPHLGHAAWNLLAAIHSHELWPALNEKKLRGEGCTPPT